MRLYRRWVFPILELWLYISFLVVDIGRFDDSTWLKFAAICLCALTALIGANSRDALFVAAAQCFTVAADWHLLVKNDAQSYVIGVGFFILVQLLYMVRMEVLRGRSTKAGPILRGLAFLTGLALLKRGELLNALALFYFANLLVNALEAIGLGERVFALGLVLFICCDVCVGLWNLNLSPALTEFARVGMWLFYLPSQVLIVLSAHRKEVSP